MILNLVDLATNSNLMVIHIWAISNKEPRVDRVATIGLVVAKCTLAIG